MLSQKARNTRRKRDASLPIVQSKKRPTPNTDTERIHQETECEKQDPCKRMKNASWGILNYLPNLPITEDEASIERHKKIIQSEYKRSHRDSVKLNELMDLTFPSRRRSIVSEHAVVTDILVNYPCLSEEEQVTIMILFPI